MEAYSKEQSNHFHQEVIDFERHYQGEFNESMMGIILVG